MHRLPRTVALGLGLWLANASPVRAEEPVAQPDDTAPARADGPVAETDETARSIEREWIVDLADNVTAADVADIAQRAGVRLVDNSPTITDDGKIALAEFADPDVALALARDPRVEAVERNATLSAYFVPNDPRYADQWHLARVGGERAWDYGCGQGVTVAVVDTGVACFDFPPFNRGTDLGGTRCVSGFDFVHDRTEAADDHGHGTHVAGTIAQTTHNGLGASGLAFCARLMPVKVLTKQGYGTLADVAEGIRFAADHGAQVINLSLGGSTRSKILEHAVQHAIARGALVVAAAGNSGRSVGYPAAYPDTLAVSATDRNDKIAWFSSRGPEVGLAAPGVQVLQQTVCDAGRNKCELFGIFNGTSMASPHVAGAAALVVGLGITRPESVRATLEASATQKDDANLYGRGIVNAGAALARAHWTHLALRLVILGLLLLALQRHIAHRGGRFHAGVLGALAAWWAAVGLVPVWPLVQRIPLVSTARAWSYGLVRPFGEWDLAWGVSWHRFLPLANALWVVAAAALFFGVRRLRPLVGGFAVGMAALLVQMAYSADVQFVGGAFVLRLWTLTNALVCLWIARLSLDVREA